MDRMYGTNISDRNKIPASGKYSQRSRHIYHILLRLYVQSTSSQLLSLAFIAVGREGWGAVREGGGKGKIREEHWKGKWRGKGGKGRRMGRHVQSPELF